METKFVYYSLDRARNGEHFEFIRTFLATFKAEEATELGLSAQRLELQRKFIEEDNALKVIQSYSNTGRITELDAERDELFRYLTQEVKNQQRSPIAARRKAAENLAPLFKNYAGTADKAQRDETGLLVNFLTDIKAFSHDDDLTALALSEVVTALETANNAFEAAFAERVDEKEFRRSSDSLKTVRPAVDKLYHDLIGMLNALNNVYSLTPATFTQQLILIDNLAPKLNAHANDVHQSLSIRDKQQGDKPIV